MTDNEAIDLDTSWSSELDALLQQLQSETLILALFALVVVGLLVVGGTRRFHDNLESLSFAVGLLLLVWVIWALHHRHRLAAAWVLIGGCLAANVLIVTWGGITEAVCLLLVPVGMATLIISRAAGMGVATLATALLLGFPPFLTTGATLRSVAALGVWSTVGMIWLTLRPLLTSVQWAWSGYEQSRTALERARDYQLRLNQTLEDLLTANKQLTRLNRQAQGLRQAAEDERRAKEQFVANVSHELRTPLNMVTGFCEMISQAPETYGADIPPKLLSDLAVVLRNSHHLSGLIDDVLDLSQIEAGQMALTKERVSLAEVAHEACLAVRPLFSSKGLYLQQDIPLSLPEIFCDRTRIREVLLNLLSNAGRFTDHGGVKLTIHRDSSSVVADVSDTGPGIAPAAQDRLFQPFQQLDNTIRRRYGGTGLGLSISKAFVELHEGRMWIQSVEGKGTTVSFSLPIDPPAPADGGPARWQIPGWEYLQPTRRSRAAVDAPPRFVVVEQDQSLQRLLTRYLDHVEIVSTTSLDEAIQELSHTPALALLVNDVSIGDMLQQLDKNQDLPYEVPVIACSLPDVGQTASALGVSDYLVKPVSREDLLSAVAHLEIPAKTVLIVDDEPDAQQLLRRMLSSSDYGYHVLRAMDGQQALEVLSRQRPDVILLDLVMPRMSGYQFLEARARDAALREIPVIAISACDPFGQPLVSSALTATCRRGLSVQELLACLKALTAILSRANLSSGRELTAKPPD